MRSKPPTMIGDTPQFYEVLNLANRYAMHDITGPNYRRDRYGQGSDGPVHSRPRPRRDRPFVGCNMTAIPETLVRS
jgi:transcriptional regulator with PAS, ATPase and Fis domain